MSDADEQLFDRLFECRGGALSEPTARFAAVGDIERQPKPVPLPGLFLRWVHRGAGAGRE